MSSLFASLGFLYPHVLWALVLLPAFYLLIRLLPPRPQQVTFPAIKLLQDLPTRLPPPRTPPWWLLLLRLAMVFFFIVGLAQPMLRRDSVELGANPLVIMVDNGWQSAQNWAGMKERLTLTLQQAQSHGAEVMVVGTADKLPDTLTFTPASEALRTLPNLAPRAWPAPTAEVAKQLAAHFSNSNATLTPLWLSDGMASVDDRRATIAAIEGIGRSRIFMPPLSDLPISVVSVVPGQASYSITLERLSTAERPVSVTLYTMDGTFVTRASGQFDQGAASTKLEMTLPKTLNEPGYVLVDGQNNLASWWGMGTIAGLPKVGIINPVKNDFPLLDGAFYIEQALKGVLIPQRLQPTTPPDGFDVLFVTTQPSTPEDIESWVQNGGVLVTFAGEWLAQNKNMNPLLPVELRDYPREVAGTLSWTGALKVKSANNDGPLAPMNDFLKAEDTNNLNPDDTYVTKQLLPRAAANSADLTWLSLSDNTPLVSGKKVGNGWQVLVHVPADASWSTVPLSGVFVELLNNLIHLKTLQSQQQETEATYPMAPFKLLLPDATLVPAQGGIQLTEEDTGLTPTTPPGLYGNRKAPFIHQLDADVRLQNAITPSRVDGLLARYYDDAEKHQSLAHIFLLLGLICAMIDSLLRLNIIHRFFLKRASVLSAVFAIALTFATPSYAQPTQTLPNGMPQGAYEIQLAYVDTGIPRLNELAENGLKGLSRILEMRTTIEPAAPAKVVPGKDDLGYYPVLYWQVLPNLSNLTEPAIKALRAYVDNGGLILVDGLTDLGQNQAAMTLVMNKVLPFPLRALDGDHVLNRSYYLLEGKTPGRKDGLLWMDTAHRLPRVLVGNNDWAGAWAYDDYGNAMRAVTPGGEQQRALAFRFGVNLVMYALLGDYKADQLHVDTLLKKLEDPR